MNRTDRMALVALFALIALPCFADNTAAQTNQPKEILLGEWTAQHPFYFGAKPNKRLNPDTYQVWLTRTNDAWEVTTKNSKGKALNSTSHVKLGRDNLDWSGFKPQTVRIEPQPAFRTVADEGPNTVHGCQCHDVTRCVDDAGGNGGRRPMICWTETVCSCFNTGQ